MAQGQIRVPRRVLREFPDRGAQWTLGDIHLAAGLLRHARPALADRLDFSRARRMPRTFIPPAFRKQENDVLWFVPYRLEGVGEGEFEEGIYLLIEHQTNPQRLQILRALTYAITVWDQEAREWGRTEAEAAAEEGAADRRCLHPMVCVVLQTGSRAWAALRTLRELMSRVDEAYDTIPYSTVLLVRLADLTEEHLAQMPPGLTAFLRMMRVREEAASVVEAALARALAELTLLDAEAEQTWQRVLHFCTMFVWSERPEGEQETLLDLLADAADRRKAGSAREVRNVARSMREVVEERAEKRGEARGEQQGEVRAARRLLLTLLETRWGAVPEDVRQAVEGLPDATEAQEALRRMVRAGTLAEVRTALNGRLAAG